MPAIRADRHDLHVRRLRAGPRPVRVAAGRREAGRGAAGLRRARPPGRAPHPRRLEGRAARVGVEDHLRHRVRADEPHQGRPARGGRRRTVAADDPHRARAWLPLRLPGGRPRHPAASSAGGIAAHRTPGRREPGDPVLPVGGRCAGGVRHLGRRAAAGEGGALAVPPRLRLGEPHLASLAPGAVARAPVRPLRRAGLRAVRLERRRGVHRHQGGRPRSGRRRRAAWNASCCWGSPVEGRHRWPTLPATPSG